MDVAMVAGFWAVAVAFVLTPGADWAYMITAGIGGRIAPAIAGLLLGHLAYVAAVAAGVGALVTRYPAVLVAITATGAAYLVWLGVGILRRPGRAHAAGVADEGTASSWFVRGFGVSGLNPKVPVLLLALLPQFTDAQGEWPVWAQLVVLGLVHVMTCGVVYTLVGVGAHRVLAARPTAATAVSRVSGALMIVLGLVLLIEQLVHART
jgi:threonine/homoserine/homoserine lactone efflux protein